MDIILLEQVPNLGKLGDVVKVRNGYGRNYLVPQGIAKRATPENLKAFEARKAELEARQNELLVDAQNKAQKLDGATVKVQQKAGVDGRLFGSLTNADLAASIADQIGVDVSRSSIRMPQGPLKSLGEHLISVALHHDVVATLKVEVHAAT
jgi:large subunit ribosomal protein L9